MPSPQDYRNLELDHAAATSVARGATTFGAFLKSACHSVPWASPPS